MNAPEFRKAVERQVARRLKQKIKLPKHFGRYLVSQKVIQPVQGINNFYKFTDSDVEAAIEWLRTPRLIQYKESSHVNNNISNGSKRCRRATTLRA